MVVLCGFSALAEGISAYPPTEPKDTLIFQQLRIYGNKRTKERIIQRELSIKQNLKVAISDTAAFLKLEREKVFNTRLFNEVNISVQEAVRQQGPDKGYELIYADVEIVVRERWYLFPLPVFELADRSFNEWLFNRNADISRVNYGIRVNQYNLTGNNDPLAVTFQTGFTQSYGLEYAFPYVDKKMNGGLKLYASYATNKQVAVSSEENKQNFVLDSNGIGRTRTNLGAAYTLRQGFFLTHSFFAGYDINTITPFLAKLNPNYFLNGRTLQYYSNVSYNLTYDKRNIRYYPTKGWYLSLNTELDGLLPQDNYRQYALSSSIARYVELGSNFFWAGRIDLMTSLPQEQAYFNATGMRFGRSFIRGYERFIVEGQHYFMAKNTFRKRVFSKVYRTGLIPFSQFNVIPIDIYVKTHADAGYIFNAMPQPTNAALTNRWLTGAGVGLDIATFYDYVLRIEYTYNHLMKGQFFFGGSIDI